MDTQTLERLRIPQRLAEICPDEATVEAVAEYLQTLPQDREAITARQRETADFINNPELLHILQRQINRLDELKERHQAENLSAAKSRVHSAHESAVEKLRPAMSNLQLIAKRAEACVKLYTDLPVYLRDFPVASDFFKHFLRTLESILREQPRLTAFVENIEALHNTKGRHMAHITTTYTLSESLTQLTHRLSSLTFAKTPAVLTRQLFLRKNNSILNSLRKREVRREKETFGLAEEFFSHSLIGALTQLTDILTLFIRNMQKPFEYIQKNLPMYKFGVALAAHCEARGVPHCFPEILPPDAPAAAPLTLMEGGDRFAYVQELVLTQLLAQAGFPLPAAQAQTAIVTGLFAQFAADELVLGRFEEEVREMAEICRRVQPRGLIIFCEVFQSTAYEDIAEPFAEIICFLHKLPCTVVVVTHNDYLATRVRTLCLPPTAAHW